MRYLSHLGWVINYGSQNGEVCGKNLKAKDVTRHWLTNRVIMEVENSQRGKLWTRRVNITKTAGVVTPDAVRKAERDITGVSR